ncbi:glutamate decarboxylase [Pseudoclavibacter endophyticus]|uniref:Glutamate decarboxylase n=1 Tax=Pseudoclavibacter endophyticus TaxID=1778590 RepID=A0A6H9WS03_9MICO|nr:glutamate decarboxylase [Pseudoclavibacter endophyticus]KAB1649100.1 glutamate decarboxylase [Pseudoclavibacter endophyticus]GGA65444.1 glutamate decarboxylase [Pseudoclavibacter endophyticus]
MSQDVTESASEQPARPAFTGRPGLRPLPATRLAEAGMEPRDAYQYLHEELQLDGSSRLNLATFVTTWMDPEADRLMAETFDKNMIDKDEYPVTARFEERCVAIVADLLNAPGLSEDPVDATGVSTVGSSEAVMLSGLALKWRWRQRRREAGAEAAAPNLVLGSNVQVVWEKFCRYFDVEPRYLPVRSGQYTITPDQVREAVDEETIGVVGILGTTYTGEFEPIAEIVAALDDLAASGGPDVPVHVDAASGGFVVPFLHPELEWDFRLPRVVSINVSGHKYGLTYPGIGFAIWRDAAHLPDELVFRVNYLGGDMPTFTLNFSRPGNQIVGQYYNFIRLGRDGYAAIMRTLRDTATWLATRLSEVEGVYIIADGSQLPVIALRLDATLGFTAHDLSHELRTFGWQVPAYTMPPDAETIAVLRIVVRDGFSRNLAERFLDDFRAAAMRLHDGVRPHADAEAFAH